MAFINLHINPGMLAMFNWAKMEQYIIARIIFLINRAVSVKIKLLMQLELNISGVLHYVCYLCEYAICLNAKNKASLSEVDNIRFSNKENVR